MQAGCRTVLKVAPKDFGFALALCICGGAADGAAPERDWKANPAIVQLKTTEEVFAIGDPHGDPDRLRGVLTAAKLMAPATSPQDPVKWTGGRFVLVVTGDLIDKGSDSLGVIKLLRTLQSDAAANGGRVIITMGNHEAEFLAYQNKKTKEFNSELSRACLKSEPNGACLTVKDVANCSGDIGRFLCDMPIAARVNDWFFSHAGNTGNRTIQQISVDIEDDFAKHQFKTDQLVGGNSILEARLHGPPWFQQGNTKPEDLLAKYVAALGVKHLVQGHQPGAVTFPDGGSRTKDRFFQRYGLLFLIDTGMSASLKTKSVGGALHIVGAGESQKAKVICPNGQEETTLWSRKTADREELLCSQ
jgi:hypothetical protein